MAANKTKEAVEVVALDIGNSFAKIGLFGRDMHGLRMLHAQNCPVFEQGFLLDQNKLGTGKPGFDLSKVLAISSKPLILASSTRFSQVKVLLAGLSNQHIEQALKFCQHMNIEATAVLTRDKLVWADENDKSSSTRNFDLVMLAGGFERNRDSHLKDLLSILVGLLEGSSSDLPVFFLGSEEVLEKVQYLFEGKRPVYLIPELWPEKKQQNFLPLYMHLQDVVVKKSLQDPVLAEFVKAHQCTVESGTSAVLAALSHLTHCWEKDVLCIDIGSSKTQVCWSRYMDGFLIPVLSDLSEEKIMFQADEGGTESQFGLRIFDFGLGGRDVDRILHILNRKGASFRWPEDTNLTLEDRIYNHCMLHSGVVPDQTDHVWLEALLETYLAEIWKSLPEDINPAHIVFSGSFFSSGLRLDHFVDNILVPSFMPYTASIWLNKGPYMSLYGMLMKLNDQMENIQIDQILEHAGEYINIIGKGSRKGIKSMVTVDLRKDTVDEYTLLVDKVQKIKFQAKNKAVVKINPIKNCHVNGYKKGEEVVLRTNGGLQGLIVDGRVIK